MATMEQPQDEYYVDAPAVRTLIDEVQRLRVTGLEPARLVDELRPAFSRLLQVDGWLPEEFARPYEASGMGGGIGQYLLYRSADRSLTLFSLVVPDGASTPVHDHLAWGLVGLYRGEQLEDVYEPVVGDADRGEIDLRLAEQRTLHAGEFYELLPPTGDIHRVTTISDQPSISIHLLGNDAGCVVRHRYDPDARTATSFRSGYSNVPCEEESTTSE